MLNRKYDMRPIYIEIYTLMHTACQYTDTHERIYVCATTNIYFT